MMRCSPVRPPRPGCPHRRLRTLLGRELPPGSTLGASTFRPWASANFVGARHIFPCTLAAHDDPATVAAMPARLASVEWTLPGHIVADVLIERGAAPDQCRIEILTVED